MKKTLTIALLLLLTITSCSSDDPSSSNDESFFTANINGVSFTASQLSTAIITQSEQLDMQRFDVTAQNESNSFNLAISSTFQEGCMSEGTYDGANALVFFNYILSNGNTVMEHSPVDDDGNSAITVVVTSCSDGKISGTFSGTYLKMGTLQDEINTPEEVVITEGKFENISFTVINQ